MHSQLYLSILKDFTTIISNFYGQMPQGTTSPLLNFLTMRVVVQRLSLLQISEMRTRNAHCAATRLRTQLWQCHQHAQSRRNSCPQNKSGQGNPMKSEYRSSANIFSRRSLSALPARKQESAYRQPHPCICLSCYPSKVAGENYRNWVAGRVMLSVCAAMAFTIALIPSFCTTICRHLCTKSF